MHVFIEQMQIFFVKKWSPNGVQRELKLEEIHGHFELPSQDASKEAKWRPRSSKMEAKWSPKGAKWRENGAPSEPTLIKQIDEK